jgi:hypothetical protein
MLNHHHIYERGRSSETMIPCLVLAIRRVFCYFACCFAFGSYTQTLQIYWLLITFCIETCKLSVPDTTVSWGRNEATRKNNMVEPTSNDAMLLSRNAKAGGEPSSGAVLTPVFPRCC